MNPPKKLLYVINVDWYFILHWLDRALMAQKSGFEIHLATRLTSESNRELLVDLGFILHDTPFNRRALNPLIELKCLLSLRSTLSTTKPQLLHSITLKGVLLAGLANLRPLHPSVYSLPGLGRMFSSSRWQHRILWYCIELLLPLALSQNRSLTLFENQHDRSTLTGNGVLKYEKSRVLPGAGVDPDHFSYAPPPVNSSTHVLFASRLLHSKGLSTLIKVIGQLHEQGVNITLDIAGIVDKGSSDSIPSVLLEKWSQLAYVNWLGELTDMVDAIHNSHIVCLPTSYGEGIPRILIEAAACGRAVISTDVPGCNEFIKHEIDGLLVQSGDSEQLSSAISYLIENPEILLAMGKAGRKKVELHYTNQEVISSTLRIYNQLLGDENT